MSVGRAWAPLPGGLGRGRIAWAAGVAARWRVEVLRTLPGPLGPGGGVVWPGCALPWPGPDVTRRRDRRLPRRPRGSRTRRTTGPPASRPSFPWPRPRSGADPVPGRVHGAEPTSTFAPR